MVYLTKSSLVADPEHVELLRDEFQHRHLVRLPHFVHPEFFTLVERSVAEGRWERYSGDFDSEEVLRQGAAVALLHFVANWPQMLNFVHQITGCGPFTWFGGRVYRMSSGAGHHDDWHTDDVDGRRVAMSINLSRRGYQGGLLQMRARGGAALLAEVANTGPGDATFFRISKALEHRVTDVLQGEPRVAFAGFFGAARPTLVDQLHQLAEDAGR